LGWAKFLLLSEEKVAVDSGTLSTDGRGGNINPHPQTTLFTSFFHFLTAKGAKKIARKPNSI
jgi:hypothetical protein